jgi:hypothetical protein
MAIRKGYQANFLTKGQTVAECLGITKRRIDQMIDEGILSRECKPSPSNYDLYACAKGYINYLKRKEIPDDETGLDPRKERALLYQSQRKKLDLEIAEREKTLLLAQEVLLLLEQLQQLYNGKIDALEGRLTGALISATGVDASVVLTVLTPELNSIRSDTAEALEKLAVSFGESHE